MRPSFQCFLLALGGSAYSSHSLSLVAPAVKTFLPPDVKNDYGVTEIACQEAASRMSQLEVPVSNSISKSGKVNISYIHWPAEKTGPSKKQTLPLLLVHGFDSSCLEFRRLGPELSKLGVDVYAVDLLGWGFSSMEGVTDFSADAKMEALRNFWTTLKPDSEVCIGGASLGGASAIEFASSSSGTDSSSLAKACVLLDAQGFTDGIGPPSLLPPFLARLGVRVLKSEQLRESANQMSYFDKEQYATEDALKIGRIHCLWHPDNQWEDAQLSFIKSGGFYPSKKIKDVNQKTLLLWGRQDNILSGEQYVPQFMETLPDPTVKWIEECGHVPHLEQPSETAKIIQEFLEQDDLLSAESDAKGVLNVVEDNKNLGVGIAATATTAAAVGIASYLLN